MREQKKNYEKQIKDDEEDIIGNEENINNLRIINKEIDKTINKMKKKRIRYKSRRK